MYLEKLLKSIHHDALLTLVKPVESKEELRGVYSIDNRIIRHQTKVSNSIIVGFKLIFLILVESKS